MKWLLGRAVIAFIVLPGVVAFLVPWLLLAPRRPDQSIDLLGVAPSALGTALLLWCAGAFYRQGRGTLAPWDPPQGLVVSGVYGLSRNPTYVGVVLVLLGWAWGFRSRSLAVYSLVVMVAFHLRVVFGVEPWLARTHGEQWAQYKARVPRWLGIPRKTAST